MSKLLANQIANYNDNGPVEVKEGVNIPTGKPLQAAGAAGTTGDYLKSTGTGVVWETFPTIPSAQVQADWNLTSGIGSIFLAVVGLVCLLMSFFLGDFSPGTGHSLWISGVSLSILSLVVPLSFIISRFVSSRSNFIGVPLSKNDASRIWSCTIIGFTLLLFGWIEDPIRVRYEVTDTSLIISGIFMLIGGVLILSTSGPIFIRQLLSLIGRLKPSISAIISLYQQTF